MITRHITTRAVPPLTTTITTQNDFLEFGTVLCLLRTVGSIVFLSRFPWWKIFCFRILWTRHASFNHCWTLRRWCDGPWDCGRSRKHASRQTSHTLHCSDCSPRMSAQRRQLAVCSCREVPWSAKPRVDYVNMRDEGADFYLSQHFPGS